MRYRATSPTTAVATHLAAFRRALIRLGFLSVTAYDLPRKSNPSYPDGAVDDLDHYSLI
jgi:hypothetical protein